MMTGENHGRTMGMTARQAERTRELQTVWAVRRASLQDDPVPHSPLVGRVFSKAKKRQFIEALSVSYNLGRAADSVGIPRSSITYWRRHDRDFAWAINAVLDEALIDAKAKLLELVAFGVRQTKTVTRTGDGEVVTVTRGESASLILAAVRLLVPGGAGADARTVHVHEAARQPSDAQLTDWLREDIEAAELAMAERAGPERDGLVRNGLERGEVVE